MTYMYIPHEPKIRVTCNVNLQLRYGKATNNQLLFTKVMLRTVNSIWHVMHNVYNAQTTALCRRPLAVYMCHFQTENSHTSTVYCCTIYLHMSTGHYIQTSILLFYRKLDRKNAEYETLLTRRTICSVLNLFSLKITSLLARQSLSRKFCPFSEVVG